MSAPRKPLAVVRLEGRNQRTTNHYPARSLEAFVWEAGRMQDVRSLEQLEQAWNESPVYTAPVYRGS